MKDCAMSYKLQVLEGTKAPESEKEVGNAIQGSIPDEMATEFFNTPIDKRDVNIFLSDEVFELKWKTFIDAHPKIDWIKQAVRYAKRQHVMLPANARDWAYEQKKAETRSYTRNVASLITALDLGKRETQAQVDFKVVLEPGKEVEGQTLPPLSIGGRIDLVVKSPDGPTEDIWDLKAVEDPRKLDIDQLIIYRMGRRAQGHFPKTMGFLLAKQCKPLVIKVADSHEFALRRLMRNARLYFVKNMWPGNYRTFWCPNYCNSRDKCPLHKARTAGTEDLKAMGIKSGDKVDF